MARSPKETQVSIVARWEAGAPAEHPAASITASSAQDPAQAVRRIAIHPSCTSLRSAREGDHGYAVGIGPGRGGDQGQVDDVALGMAPPTASARGRISMSRSMARSARPAANALNASSRSRPARSAALRPSRLIAVDPGWRPPPAAGH
jgi:hypothetical protein